MKGDSDRESYGYSIEETHFGIDQFIGEPSLFNKGYGTEVADGDCLCAIIRNL